MGAVSCDVALQVGGAGVRTGQAGARAVPGALSTTGLRSSSAPGSRARTASGWRCSRSASRRHRRDASRLLADASLLVQQPLSRPSRGSVEQASTSWSARPKTPPCWSSVSRTAGARGSASFGRRSSTAHPHRRSSFAAATAGRTGSAREAGRATRGRSRTGRRGSGRRARTARASRRATEQIYAQFGSGRQSGVTKLVCSRRWSSQARGECSSASPLRALLGALAGWALGGTGLGLVVGLIVGIPMGILAVHRRYRSFFT